MRRTTGTRRAPPFSEGTAAEGASIRELCADVDLGIERPQLAVFGAFLLPQSFTFGEALGGLRVVDDRVAQVRDIRIVLNRDRRADLLDMRLQLRAVHVLEV